MSESCCWSCEYHRILFVYIKTNIYDLILGAGLCRISLTAIGEWRLQDQFYLLLAHVNIDFWNTWMLCYHWPLISLFQALNLFVSHKSSNVKGVVPSIIRSTPKSSSRHFIFLQKCICFEWYLKSVPLIVFTSPNSYFYSQPNYSSNLWLGIY